MNRRKKFAAPLRGGLIKSQAVRDAADYQPDPIQAIRAVERAEQFVSAVVQVLREGSTR